MACIDLHNICIARYDPCRGKLDIEKLDHIRNGGSGEQDGEADQVRERITN